MTGSQKAQYVAKTTKHLGEISTQEKKMLNKNDAFFCCNDSFVIKGINKVILISEWVALYLPLVRLL